MSNKDQTIKFEITMTEAGSEYVGKYNTLADLDAALLKIKKLKQDEDVKRGSFGSYDKTYVVAYWDEHSYEARIDITGYKEEQDFKSHILRGLRYYLKEMRPRDGKQHTIKKYYTQIAKGQIQVLKALKAA